MANIKEFVRAPNLAAKLEIWSIWIFGQAHLKVIAMKSDEIASLILKIAEFLLNSDSLANPKILFRSRCKGVKGQ